MPRAVRLVLALAVLLAAAPAAFAQAPVTYHLSFPDRQHRLMDVEVTFQDLPEAPLQLRMSRSSPGRYATHDFAKNVFGVDVADEAGRPLTVTRPNPHQWDVTGHGGIVQLRYRIFGDRLDGTYLAVDSTHAHINMPAALMWARGLEHRPVTVRFEPPPGSNWRVATQLFPTDDPFTFTAPNLQYLMDSPAEVSDFSERSFTIEDGNGIQTVRLAVHHEGSDADLDGFARDIEAIVRESRRVFGEYPVFEGRTYTFIANYLPWASSDGMEHRNSTVLTSPVSIRTGRAGLLNTAAHEFVHVWNVERIRPRSLEPFDFEDANLSGELWFAEGFTSYYAAVVLQRAGLTSLDAFADDMGRMINAVAVSPARAIRTAEEMSRMAPFVDAAVSIDRASFENTFLSYYTWGAVIALGLDLTLRDRSDGRATLDHYMQALWQRHGRPGGVRPGYVDHPYTMADLRDVLGEVAGDAPFAGDFFARYIQGHEIVDLAPLLARAGLHLQPLAADRGFAGILRLQDARDGVRITGPVPFDTPAFAAGLERDDVILSLDGRRVTRAIDVLQAIQSRRPGDVVPIEFDRRGERVSAALAIVADPRLQLVSAERAGRPLDEAQRRFRDAWLESAERQAAGRPAREEAVQVVMCGPAPCR